MRIIGDQYGRGAWLVGGVGIGSTDPSLALSQTVIAENTAPGTTLGVAVPRNATNPGPVTIVAQGIANALAMTGDGITYAVGSAGGPTGTLNYEADPTFTVTFQYTNDVGGPAEEVLQFTRTFTLTDVDDGPTTTGAATDLETMIGAAEVGTAVTGDLRDLFVSPTGQALTFAVSHGTIDVDGYSWTWTPGAAGVTTVSVTATDEDGQDLAITHTPDVAAAPPPNNAPVAGDITLTFIVPPPAGDVTAPTLSSPIGTKTGTTTANGGVTTDEANGTIFMVTTTSATAPSADQIIAATDESDASAAFDSSLAVTTSGAKTFAITGLSPGTTYYNHYTHVDAAGNKAAPVTSSAFTTDAPAAGITIVGTAMDGADNGANVVVDLSGISMEDGDRIIAFCGGSSGVFTAITCSTTGFALIDPPGDMAISDTYKTNFSLFEHVVSGTPPTSVTMATTYNSTGAGAGGAIVLRGVDPSTPLDQAIASLGGTNTAYADPASVTPGSANALIVVMGFCSTGPAAPTPYTGPANMTGFEQASGIGSQRGGTAFLALKTDPANGVAFDPDPLTAGTDSTSACWAAATLTFKAA